MKRVHPELEVYKRLQEKKVQYIATAIGGGNVGEPDAQRTVTQEYMSDRDDIPAERLHNRLVIEELGRALDTYELSMDMIVAISHALEGVSFLEAAVIVT